MGSVGWEQSWILGPPLSCCSLLREGLCRAAPRDAMPSKAKITAHLSSEGCKEQPGSSSVSLWITKGG